jgi:hypothetical protein
VKLPLNSCIAAAQVALPHRLPRPVGQDELPHLASRAVEMATAAKGGGQTLAIASPSRPAPLTLLDPTYVAYNFDNSAPTRAQAGNALRQPAWIWLCRSREPGFPPHGPWPSRYRDHKRGHDGAVPRRRYYAPSRILRARTPPPPLRTHYCCVSPALSRPPNALAKKTGGKAGCPAPELSDAVVKTRMKAVVCTGQ